MARDLPIAGKLGMHRSLQNYVVLTLPSIYQDERWTIYDCTKTAIVEDTTKDFVSRRDQRRRR